jgi:hypothetical protein
MGGIIGKANRQKESLDINPQLLQQLQQASQGLQQQVGQIGGQAGAAAGQIQTNFGQFAPTLDTQFQRPEFSQQLDPLAQRLATQGTQGLQQQAQARQQNIANQFRGNPGASRILQQQVGATSALQANPLLFQAAQQQQGREAQQFQLQSQAQQLSNQALQQQQAEAARFQGMQNQAVAGQFQLGQQFPLQAQQSLLQALAAQAQLTGTKRTSGRSGGIF